MVSPLYKNTYCYLSIIGYAAVSISDWILIIGGSGQGSQVTKYSNEIWERIGNLNSQRTSHSAIYHNKQILIFGGSRRYDSEP